MFHSQSYSKHTGTRSSCATILQSSHPIPLSRSFSAIKSSASLRQLQTSWHAFQRWIPPPHLTKRREISSTIACRLTRPCGSEKMASLRHTRWSNSSSSRLHLTRRSSARPLKALRPLSEHGRLTSLASHPHSIPPPPASQPTPLEKSAGRRTRPCALASSSGESPS
jgi:hypothetical protein